MSHITGKEQRTIQISADKGLLKTSGLYRLITKRNTMLIKAKEQLFHSFTGV